MKTLKNYIYEAVEVTDDRLGNYKLLTLHKRENVDCANISAEDFAKFIVEDVETAIKAYSEFRKPMKEEEKAKYIERRKADIIKYAEKRYKRQSNRDKYIQNAIENIKDMPDYDNITFFDFDVEPGRNGILNDCILREGITTEDALRCFKEIKDNKYFKRATGWAFKAQANKDSMRYAFRPYVDLICDESTAKEMEDDAQRLADSISKFYANTNYWGD